MTSLEDSSCFVSQCSCDCQNFPVLVLLNMSEKNMLLYSVLVLRVFGNNVFELLSGRTACGSRYLEKWPL